MHLIGLGFICSPNTIKVFSLTDTKGETNTNISLCFSNFNVFSFQKCKYRNTMSQLKYINILQNYLRKINLDGHLFLYHLFSKSNLNYLKNYKVFLALYVNRGEFS